MLRRKPARIDHREFFERYRKEAKADLARWENGRHKPEDLKGWMEDTRDRVVTMMAAEAALDRLRVKDDVRQRVLDLQMQRFDRWRSRSKHTEGEDPRRVSRDDPEANRLAMLQSEALGPWRFMRFERQRQKAHTNSPTRELAEATYYIRAELWPEEVIRRLMPEEEAETMLEVKSRIGMLKQ